MDRRHFLAKTALGLLGVGGVLQAGCRGRQTAQVLKPGEADMVGTHSAGAETFKPLVDECVTRLLSRHAQGIQPVAFQSETSRMPMQICFIGVENKTVEEIGDFREQLYEAIDTAIVKSQVYQPISRRYVEAGLRECRLRPDQLMIPDNQAVFTAALQRMNQPFDYLLYATLTSGTTHSNKDYQRDYMLTLEMVDIHTGQYDKESAMVSKGYNVSLKAKVKNWHPF
jgi:hypothetical protein